MLSGDTPYGVKVQILELCGCHTLDSHMILVQLCSALLIDLCRSRNDETSAVVRKVKSCSSYNMQLNYFSQFVWWRMAEPCGAAVSN